MCVIFAQEPGHFRNLQDGVGNPWSSHYINILYILLMIIMILYCYHHYSSSYYYYSSSYYYDTILFLLLLILWQNFMIMLLHRFLC